VVYEDSDASDLSSDDLPSTVHLQLKLKKPQLRSILKRSQPVNDGSKSGNRYAITVVPYRSTCCKVIVRLEHLPEIPIHPAKAYNGQCPSCNTWGSLKSDHLDAQHRQTSKMAHPIHSAPSPSPKHSRHVQFAEQAMVFDISDSSLPISCIPAASKALAPSSCSIPPPRVSFDAIYSLFNTDFGEAYPDSEYSASLSSTTASSEMYDTFIRVMSVGGLTVLLYSVLT